MTAAPTKGTRVRFTRDGLGVLDPMASGPAMLDWYVGTEDEGQYEAADKSDGGKSWHFVTIERDGAFYVVPVRLDMIEVIE